MFSTRKSYRKIVESVSADLSLVVIMGHFPAACDCAEEWYISAMFEGIEFQGYHC